MKNSIYSFVKFTDGNRPDFYRDFVSGVINGKRFIAERKWKGNLNSRWQVADEGLPKNFFTLEERRAIGRFANKEDKVSA